MNFPDEFVTINVGNIRPTVLRKLEINYFKFLAVSCCLNCARAVFGVQVSCTRQITKQNFSQPFQQRDNATKGVYIYKNWFKSMQETLS